MAILSYGEAHGRIRVEGRPVLPVWQRIAVGAGSGVMPVVVSLAVVQGAPAVDAVDALVYGGRDGVPAETNAIATILGLTVLTVGLACAGVLSALWQRGQVERLALFQTSLVAPALLFVAIQVIGMTLSPAAGEGDDLGAQVLVTGVTSGGGDPVRIAVYAREAPDPVDCFLQGLRGRGC